MAGIANLVSNTTPQYQNPNVTPFGNTPQLQPNQQQNVNQITTIANNQFDEGDIGKQHKVLSTFLSSFINQDFFTKVINVTLYQSDFTSANVSLKTSEVTKFINQFINEVNKKIKKSPISFFNDVPKSTLLSTTSLIREILNLREDITGRLVTYDNILKHFPKQDITVTKTLTTVANERIQNQDQFKEELENVLQTIQTFNEIDKLSSTFSSWDIFLEDAKKDNLSPINFGRLYRQLIIKSYNELAELTTVTKQDELDDYVVLHDKLSTKKVVDNLMSFLSQGYNFFKTGYELIDKNVDGLESSTFHLISGPSNHAKSIFMINLCRKMLQENKNDFVKGDVFVYITLEDDLNKVLRRFISIFGNYDSKVTKQLFIVASSLFKQIQESYDKTSASSLISELLTNVIDNAIIKHISNGNCKIIIKHCAENSFSPADATKFIDSLKIQGYNTKAMFVDYVDVMRPSSTRYNNYNDYDAHGMIIHELRKISQNYKLPVVSITQNTRESENTAQAMGNNLIGDSYKKVRFSDYIYMVRMRRDLDLQSATVKSDIIELEDGEEQTGMFDIGSSPASSDSIPFEIEITKAKEGNKNIGKFHIFSGMNLRIYDTLRDFYGDVGEAKRNNKGLEDQIKVLQMGNTQQLAIGSGEQSQQLI